MPAAVPPPSPGAGAARRTASAAAGPAPAPAASGVPAVGPAPAGSTGLPPAPDLPPGKLTVVGTGHVFQVRDTIVAAMQAWRPDIVFVELDRGRLHALQQRAKGAAPPAGGGLVHKRLQRFQEEVAGSYGASVGEEMLAAVEGAQLVGAKVALIDPPADATVGKVLKQLTWRERLRGLGLLIKSGVTSVFRRDSPSVESEIKRYQDDPDQALEELRRQFPTIHRIVIAERDAVMARRIAHLLKGHRHGVAVVGDGHVPGLLRLLDDLHPEVFRLADVRSGRLPRPPASLATGTSTSISFGFDATGTFVPQGRAPPAPPAHDPRGGRDGGQRGPPQS